MKIRETKDFFLFLISASLHFEYLVFFYQRRLNATVDSGSSKLDQLYLLEIKTFGLGSRTRGGGNFARHYINKRGRGDLCKERGKI